MTCSAAADADADADSYVPKAWYSVMDVDGIEVCWYKSAEKKLIEFYKNKTCLLKGNIWAQKKNVQCWEICVFQLLLCFWSLNAVRTVQHERDSLL